MLLQLILTRSISFLHMEETGMLVQTVGTTLEASKDTAETELGKPHWTTLRSWRLPYRRCHFFLSNRANQILCL